MVTLGAVREFYKAHKGAYLKRSDEAVKLGQSSDDKELFVFLCHHLLGSGACWRRAVGAVDHLDKTGVLWTGGQPEIEQALRARRYRGKYFGARKPSNWVYQNRELLYKEGLILPVVGLIGEVSKQDPILARNAVAGQNKRVKIHVKGTDIELKDMHIEGLGMKWASHFLRGLGFSHNELGILDSHILEHLVLYGAIKSASENLSAEVYLDFEDKMKKWACHAIPEIPLDHFDWVLWDMASGSQCD